MSRVLFILMVGLWTVKSVSGQAPGPAGSQPPKKNGIGLGLKVGLNFADVTDASDLNTSSLAGFNLGVFLAPHSRGVIGSRTELVFSKHGYNYASDTANGSVNLDYIMLCQYMAIHITRFVEIDIGGQTAYLLSVKVDSTTKSMGGVPNSSTSSLLSYYNRFDYGYGIGAEVHPFMGICLGARYSVSLSNLYKQFLSGSTTTGQQPSFVPNTPAIDLKNNVVQVYLGYRF
jgi:hypothetical protein